MALALAACSSPTDEGGPATPTGPSSAQSPGGPVSPAEPTVPTEFMRYRGAFSGQVVWTHVETSPASTCTFTTEWTGTLVIGIFPGADPDLLGSLSGRSSRTYLYSTCPTWRDPGPAPYNFGGNLTGPLTAMEFRHVLSDSNRDLSGAETVGFSGRLIGDSIVGTLTYEDHVTAANVEEAASTSIPVTLRFSSE